MRTTDRLACAFSMCLLTFATGTIGPSAQTPQVFRSTTEIVELTVTVTDPTGRPVTDLNREDFTVLEEGRPQTISVFDRVNVPHAEVSRASRGTPLEVIANDVRPEGRVFAIILDDQLTQPTRTMAVRRLAREFIEKHVNAGDLVGLFSTGGRSALGHDFTTDHKRLIDVIDRFQGNRTRQLESEAERVYSVETAMDAIEELALRLSSVRGRRVAALFVSEGIDYDVFTAMQPTVIPSGGAADSPIPGGKFVVLDGGQPTDMGRDRRPEPTPIIRAVQRALDALTRSNVVLYGVDPRGLYSQETEWLEHNPRDVTAAPPPDPKELARSIQSLRVISERTGGFAAVNTNDFGQEFDQIVEETSRYYVIGYAPTRTGVPGEYRRITIKVRPGLRVAAREGYVVPAPSSLRMTDRPELAALDDPLPIGGLGLRVQAVPLFTNGGASRVQLVLEIDGSGLSFTENAGRFSERVNIAVKAIPGSPEGKTAAFSTALQSLTATQQQRVVKNGLRWLTSLELPPGNHNLRIAAHSVTSGKTGSVFAFVSLPRPEPGELSDLLLSAASAAETPTTGEALSFDAFAESPTLRRSFGLGDTIVVAAGITVGATGRTTVSGTVSKLEGSSETPIVQGTLPIMRSPSNVDFVRFTIPTANFGPGEFAVSLRSDGPDGTSKERKVRFAIVPAR